MGGMTASDDLAQDVGRLEGRVAAIERELADARVDLKAIRSTLDQGRGGVRLLIGAISLGASAGSALTYLASALGWFKGLGS